MSAAASRVITTSETGSGPLMRMSNRRAASFASMAAIHPFLFWSEVPMIKERMKPVRGRRATQTLGGLASPEPCVVKRRGVSAGA